MTDIIYMSSDIDQFCILGSTSYGKLCALYILGLCWADSSKKNESACLECDKAAIDNTRSGHMKSYEGDVTMRPAYAAPQSHRVSRPFPTSLAFNLTGHTRH